jgi:DNA repair protein RecO (recombination protein O)
MPVGESLLAGIYLNEMLLKLLARDDPHPLLFDAYTRAVARLAETPEPWPGVLRAFELTLLRETGVLPSLGVEAHTLAPLEPGRRYGLEADHGLVAVEAAWDGSQRPFLVAEQWLALQQALDQSDPFDALLHVLQTGIPAALQTLLRSMLHYHCGVRMFKTRQMMRDVHTLARR